MSSTKPETKERNTGKHLVGKRTRDAFTFLFFVLVCLAFWFVQRLEETFAPRITVPVKLTNVPKDVVITKELPEEIYVTVRGKGVDLLPYLLFNAKSDTCKISYNTFSTENEYGTTLISSEDIRVAIKSLFPSQSIIQDIEAKSLSFSYNKCKPKQLPVRMAGKVTAQDQYHILGYEFTPEKVDVYAPKEVLDTMQAVYTIPVYRKDIKESFEQTIDLQQFENVCARPSQVKMKTQVDIYSGQTVEVPVVGVNFPANKMLCTFPQTVTICYRVPSSLASKIKAEDFTVVISYEELMDNESNMCRPHINQVPENTSGAYIDPVEVEYVIENIRTEESVPQKESKKQKH